VRLYFALILFEMEGQWALSRIPDRAAVALQRRLANSWRQTWNDPQLDRSRDPPRHSICCSSKERYLSRNADALCEEEWDWKSESSK
jgi:hypothetical protein